MTGRSRTTVLLLVVLVLLAGCSDGVSLDDGSTTVPATTATEPVPTSERSPASPTGTRTTSTDFTTSEATTTPSASASSGETSTPPSTSALTSTTTTTTTTTTTATTTTTTTTTGAANAPPVAEAVADPTVTVGAPTGFDASASSDPDGTIVQYKWDFDGDGTVDHVGTTPTVTASYATSGSYTATVTVSDDRGATATDTVRVDVVANAPPTATLGPDRSVAAGETVLLDASASSDPDGAIARYEWDYDGDGAVDATSTGPTVQHTYSTVGTYVATLTVTDDDGATATDTVTVTATSAAPVADLGRDRLGNPGDTFTFDASASTDPDGSIVQYAWDFDGDGTTDATTGSPTASYIYDRTGTYTAVLRVTDDDGATDTDAVTVSIVGNTPPDADAGPDDSIVVGDAYTFDASGSADPDGAIVQYAWDFDGDGAYDIQQGTPTAAYGFAATGQYPVTVRVTDDEGGTATDEILLTVSNTAPVAALGPDRTASDATVTLDASASTDPDGHALVAYAWDFDGDGTTEARTSFPTTSTTYGTSGTYTVRVTVYDAYEATDTDTVTITVP